MHILHLSTSDLEGGAARAAYRLHQGLQTQGIASKMLVRSKQSEGDSVLQERSWLTKLGPTLNRLPSQLWRSAHSEKLSSQWVPDPIASRVRRLNPDIVHLHWICNGFVQIETLPRFNKPLVWTIHDMWPLTGGCHYSQTCDRYTQSCGACPQLGGTQSWDLSRWTWQRKARAWKNLSLTLVAPSTWVADQVKASSLFQQARVEVIPHGLDTTIFKPIDRAFARQLLNLPQDRPIILYGASSGIMHDSRKGFQLLQPALEHLQRSGQADAMELVIFGMSQPSQSVHMNIPVRYLGRLQDSYSLALIYSAADVMVVPSMQETFGQTASEALSCGTPVVAFNATGLKDVVAHHQDGYLAEPFVVEDLARGIAWVLSDRDRHQQLRQAARQKAERAFSVELQVQRHLTLYQQLLDLSDQYQSIPNLAFVR